MKKLDERPVPKPALRDPNSREVLRVWIAERALHCSLRVGIYENSNVSETKAWGIILADVARHLCNALNEEISNPHCISEISQAFMAEIEKPTSKSEGSFVR